ncbi:hypothetical protein QWY87_12945 [Lutimonas halocynthiae]|uniref:Cap15 family cyclic dinucleotide receptor domain-containing protein n=1 Tax=Lutimonas halocynthiae TaxID=1446477 RepID=UPI0025B281EE|nr:hypothetical protein [Lutimonas halocynthiae]MDN3643617.1 hypothetical protein [Lutimonas halocynthiae]
MKQDFLKYYKSNFLVFLIGILLFIVISAKSHWNLSISIFSIVTTFLVTITNYLWKYKPFKWLFTFDDFSGRYEGILRYQYKNESGELITDDLRHIKIIKQNGSGISVSSFTYGSNGTKSSESVNKGMHIEKTKDEQHHILIYNFLNDGNQNKSFPPHYGTDVLKFIKNGNMKLLSGRYFTERYPFQTRGEYIKLQWVSNNLNHDF